MLLLLAQTLVVEGHCSFALDLLAVYVVVVLFLHHLLDRLVGFICYEAEASGLVSIFVLHNDAVFQLSELREEGL